MASFFNVAGLVNPFSTQVGQRIEQATDASLASEDWALNMEICDLINNSSDTARDAMKAIRKRLSQNAGKQNNVIMLTLTVLETCVKNCGKAFHVLVAQKDFIQELVKLIGPKNDPPAIMQEKVLSLIQIWADAFKNQPDLNGVTQMYIELKNKGIEFPATDMDAVAPIYTPQRSVPEPQPQLLAQHNSVSPQHGGIAVPAGLPQNNGGSGALNPEQTVKLQSELEVVAHSMSILNEMLSELKPGLENADDYILLTELTATCKEMQGRIVELIGRIQDDEMTAELLRLNDELNNLFLRHQRYEKNRSSHTATSPSEILGAAIGPPPIVAAAASGGVAGAAAGGPSENDLILLDLKSDKLQTSFSQIGITPKPAKDKDVDEFDMLAQSRTDSQNKSDLLKDIPSVDAAAGSIGSPYKRADPSLVSKAGKERDIVEIEAWLGSTKDSDVPEEKVTSTDFDKFLMERAAAADNLPTIISTNSSNNDTTDSQAPKKTPKKGEEEDLLAL